MLMMNLAAETEQHVAVSVTTVNNATMALQAKDPQLEQLGTSIATAGMPDISMMAEEENYPEPGSLQEELNQILDAFYECVNDEDIRAYQRHVEDIQGQRIAEQALIEPAMAPPFELEDQDGDIVSLHELLKRGPVVLTFYRGKWCPQCNATLVRYQKHLVPAMKPYGATLVAISPLMPDGTAFLASKRDLEFSICSDFDNALAKDYRLTFTVQPNTRPFIINCGDNLPDHNGVHSWDIPLPATYVISQDGHISWSFLDNDPGIRAEPEDIVRQVAKVCQNSAKEGGTGKGKESLESPKPRRKLFNRSFSATFGWKPKFMKKSNKWKTTEMDVETALAIATQMERGDMADDNSNSSRGSSRYSTKSDGALMRNKKKSPKEKGKRGRNQSAQEYFGQFFLT